MYCGEELIGRRVRYAGEREPRDRGYLLGTLKAVFARTVVVDWDNPALPAMVRNDQVVLIPRSQVLTRKTA